MLYAILMVLVVKLIMDYKRKYSHKNKNKDNNSKKHTGDQSDKNIDNFINDDREIKVKFNPVISTEINSNSKYKLYGDNFMVSKPAGKVDCKYDLDFDQTTNKNIIEHINAISQDDRTIREIYNEITNDHRLEYQQNLDELQGYNDRTDYEISYGSKYGSTRFDTFNVKPKI